MVPKGGWLPWPRLGRCWPESPRQHWGGCSLQSGSPGAGPGDRYEASQPPSFPPTLGRLNTGYPEATACGQED